VENKQDALEKARQKEKNNTIGGKKHKKVQIIEWWLKHGAKEDGRKKTRKNQVVGWMSGVFMSKTA
jgi:type II secretory pathway component PulJ